MSQAETEELEPDDDTFSGRDVMPWTTTLEPAPMPADPFPLEEEPLPRLSVAESMRLYRFTALLPVLLLLGAAIALGLLRDPTYTATARSQVLIAASSPSSLAGSADAGTDFAATYARAIDAEEIVGQVARETDLTRDQVNDRISATPVPDAAVLSVSATGTNEGVAVLGHQRPVGAQDVQARRKVRVVVRVVSLDQDVALPQRVGHDRVERPS